MPSNSLGNAPQLSKFKVAVVQNSYAGNGVVAEWEAVTPGARFKYVRITNQVPKRADDVAQGASGPTYHQPTSLTVGGETTSDTPRVFPTLTTIEGDGATYRLKTLSFSNTWDDWCVLYDSSVGQVNPYAAISESSLDAGWNLFINLYQTASPSAFHIPGTAGSMILTNDSTQFANNLAKASEPYFHN